MTQTATEKLEAALAEALPKLGGAKKTSNNPHFKSNYADLGSVIEAIRPIAEHGIWFRQATQECDTGVKVETFYTGFGATISAGILHMPADRNNAQGYGSALTYARRYALQTAFGLATEDDDGNEASKTDHPRQEQPKQERPKQERPKRLETITEDQEAELIAHFEGKRVSIGSFLKYSGLKSLKEVRSRNAGKVIAWIDEQANASIAAQLGDEIKY